MIKKDLFIEQFKNYNFEEKDLVVFIECLVEGLYRMIKDIYPSFSNIDLINLREYINYTFVSFNQYHLHDSFTEFGIFLKNSMEKNGFTCISPDEISFSNIADKNDIGLFINSIDGLKEFADIVEDWIKTGEYMDNNGVIRSWI